MLCKLFVKSCCLVVLSGLYPCAAHATENPKGYWKLTPYIPGEMSGAPAATTTPSGASLGDGGGCYYSVPPLAYTLVNASSVNAAASWSGHRDATWVPDPSHPDLPPAYISVSLTAHISGTWEQGATTATTYSGFASSSCGPYQAGVQNGASRYPDSYGDDSTVKNSDGGPLSGTQFSAIVTVDAHAFNKGAYAYSTGTADFTAMTGDDLAMARRVKSLPAKLLRRKLVCAMSHTRALTLKTTNRRHHLHSQLHPKA